MWVRSQFMWVRIPMTNSSPFSSSITHHHHQLLNLAIIDAKICTKRYSSSLTCTQPSFPIGKEFLLKPMWDNIPFDLLANIFSYLPPDSLARVKATCRNWHATAESTVASASLRRHPPWFLALPTRGRRVSCYIHNPIGENWNLLPLNHITTPIRPIATIGGLILVRLTATTSLQLAISNPFTKRFRSLPLLNVARTNPAVGIIQQNPSSSDFFNSGFKIYVAGGMFEAASGGAAYHPTIEMYDSQQDTWRIVGSMPVEFAVRLTVWTPNESVYSNGVIYWMTSARAYSVMGFEIETNKWREMSVPMAERLDFAALIPRNGRLAVAGGTCGSGACVWELREDDCWCVIERVPIELREKILGDKRSWGMIKCVGINGAMCLYKDLGSGFIVWREVVVGEGKWEWDWIEGCCFIKGKKIHNFQIKGLLIHPDLVLDSINR